MTGGRCFLQRSLQLWLHTRRASNHARLAANRIHVLSVDFANRKAVDNFLAKLTLEEYSTLKKSLEECQTEHEGRSVTSLNFRALTLTALSNGLPFIGFGFLDNAIMILAGESIESTWGSIMGISTMASAALGNWVSDIAGLGTAGYVEAICHRFGIRPPEMSHAQMNLTSTRLVIILSRCLGITIGCLLGMFPLLFFSESKSDHAKKSA